jgi:hypothetical protein
MFLLMLACVSLAAAQCTTDYGPIVLNSSTDFVDDNSLIEMGNDCFRRPGEDAIYVLNVEITRSFSIWEAYATSHLYLLHGCCSGVDVAHAGPEESLDCIVLEQGQYFLVVEAASESDDYQLNIEACPDPCEDERYTDGIIGDGQSFRYVETVDGSSGEPNYLGPWTAENSCQDESVDPDADTYGFGYYSWYNQDYGWTHLFDPNTECDDLVIDSAFVVICAYDVDYCFQNPRYTCEFDQVTGDENYLFPYHLDGSNMSNHATRFWVDVNAVTDGSLNMWLDIDYAHGQCTWATTVNWSQLVVYYHACTTVPEPAGFDLGDLPPFNDFQEPCYTTGDVESGGPANPIWVDNYAWLGAEITIDPTGPNVPDLDGADDGVVFLNGNGPGGSWIPCEQVCVEVTVTTGEAYEGEPLYLWGWKDGNLDCDFNDMLCISDQDDTVFLPTECIIQGEPIQQGSDQSVAYEFCFTDPGEMIGQGRYNGVFRFRLVSSGDLDCFSAQTGVDELLGETEDYIVEDLQLAVELLDFSAQSRDGKVMLSWSTGSETDNQFFEVQRHTGNAWDPIGQRVDGAGNSSVTHNYGFVDENVTIGNTYQYRLVAVDIWGARQVLGEVEAVVTSGVATITDYHLYANYPNPFNPGTSISYDLPEASNVSLRVFDVLGRDVAELVHGYQTSGHYSIHFDAGVLPSGVYFYCLETPQFSDMKKMMLLK